MSTLTAAGPLGKPAGPGQSPRTSPTRSTVRPHRMVVEDVMSRVVISVGPSATFHDMVGLMTEHGISALPVVADERLVGIVSEADLLLKESPQARHRPWMPESSGSATRRRKSHGATAGEIMTSPVLTVTARTALGATARLLQKHQVKRLVVVDANDSLVGIVSRRDLLAPFARTDTDIEADVLEGVFGRWMLVDPTRLRVHVAGGVVHVGGEVDRRSEAEILVHLVLGLDGVVDVVSTVEFRWDDRDVALSRELRT